jgi:hypothetical protein
LSCSSRLPKTKNSGSPYRRKSAFHPFRCYNDPSLFRDPVPNHTKPDQTLGNYPPNSKQTNQLIVQFRIFIITTATS